MAEAVRIGAYTLHRDGRVYSDFKGAFKTTRLDAYGYAIVDLSLDGTRVTAKLHRLLAVHFIGEPPTSMAEVDHINGDRADNRIENLRWVASAENKWNRHVPRESASGLRGVRYRAEKRNPWQAYGHLGKRFKSLGHFPTADDAVAARAQFERTHQNV